MWVIKENDYLCVGACVCVCACVRACATALTLCGCDMTHCKWCHGRSIVEIKMAVDGGEGRKCVSCFSPSLHTTAEAFWFKRINGSAQGYFSLTGAIQNNTPGPYFLEEPHALHPLFLFPPLPLTIGEVIRHECRGLRHEWMSSCNAPMTFCYSLLDLRKRRERGGKRERDRVRKRNIKENPKKKRGGPLKSLGILSSMTVMCYCLPRLTQSRC